MSYFPVIYASSRSHLNRLIVRAGRRVFCACVDRKMPTTRLVPCLPSALLYCHSAEALCWCVVLEWLGSFMTARLSQKLDYTVWHTFLLLFGRWIICPGANTCFRPCVPRQLNSFSTDLQLCHCIPVCFWEFYKKLSLCCILIHVSTILSELFLLYRTTINFLHLKYEIRSVYIDILSCQVPR